MHHPLLLSARLDYPLGHGPRAYRAFVEATDALLKDEADHPDLLAKLDEMRDAGEEEPRLPVNVENVVIQSRCDRKGLVGGKKRPPRYPLLAAFIRQIKATHGVKQTTTALIERLQTETREWKQRERVLRSKLAERTLELADARRDLVEAREEIRRRTAVR